MSNKKDRAQRILIFLAMAAAVALMIVLGGRYLGDGKKLTEKQLELETSRETWERIAAEKEELQDELKEVTNELKEAKLTLEESTTRAGELREQIETLKDEIETMKSGK